MGQILAGALGGLGFSIVFGVRKKYMVLIALNAGLSWAVYLAVNALAGDFAGHVLQPNSRSSGPAHQGPYRRAPDARHRAHDSRWQPLLHDALCLLGRYAQCQALFPLHHPCYLRYGHRFCCGECPAQDAGRKAYPRHSRRLISGLSCGELR